MKLRKYSPIVIGIIICIVVTVFTVRSEISTVQNRLLDEAKNILDYSSDRANFYEVALEGFASFISAEKELNISRAREYVHHLRIMFPDIYVMEVSQRVMHHQKDAFEKKIRASGYPEFNIHTFGFETDRKFHPVNEKPYYYPIVFMEPELPEASGVFGLDLAETSSSLSTALRRSAKLGHQVASMPFDLMQGNRGYVLYRPILDSINNASERELLTAPYYALLVVDTSSLVPELSTELKGLAVSIWTKDSELDKEVNVYASHNNVDNDYTPSLIFPIFEHTLHTISDSQPFTLKFKYEMGWKDINTQLIGGSLIAAIFAFLVALRVSSSIYKKEIKIRQEALQKAEDASLAKSKFLSYMSHELRTPLNSILGFSQLLNMKENDEEKRESIQHIIVSGNHLLELINEMFELTFIKSGDVELSIENHSLHEILEESLSMIKPLADQHNIQINEMVSSLPDISINIDKERFKQVLLSILSNAIKYNSEKGKVTIECSSNDKNMLSLSITDTGKGFTIKQLSHLFEPFERFEAVKSYNEGTGLGLVIAKDLVELMGGTITVESEIGKGSSFIIQVPLS